MAGRRVVDWSLLRAREVSDDCVLVTPDGAPPPGGLESADLPANTVVVAGGDQRSDSVRQALAVIPPEVTTIVVHDAARPCASAALFDRVCGALVGDVDGVIPGLPVTDTIKVVDGDRVVETLDRDRLVAVQTPQAFRADALRRAHAQGVDATDDAALVESMDGTVIVVPGEADNVKITVEGDIVRAEQVLR